MNGGPIPTEKKSYNVIIFSKEHFNIRLHFPLPSLFRQFLHFTKIPPAFLHLNVVRVLMGSSILDMLFRLDLSLLEVIFIYIVKMSEKWIFNLSAHIPFLQLVTSLPDSTKSAAKGHVIVSSPWVGLLDHPGREFKPRHSLAILGRIDHSSFCFILAILLIVSLLLMFIALRAIEKKKKS